MDTHAVHAVGTHWTVHTDFAAIQELLETVTNAAFPKKTGVSTTFLVVLHPSPLLPWLRTLSSPQRTKNPTTDNRSPLRRMRLDYLTMYVGIVTLSIIGFLLFLLIDLADAVFCRWNNVDVGRSVKWVVWEKLLGMALWITGWGMVNCGLQADKLSPDTKFMQSRNVKPALHLQLSGISCCSLFIIFFNYCCPVKLKRTY